MTGSSTTAMPLGNEATAQRNNPRPQSGAVTKNNQDVRQGKRGSTMVYVLAASVLLLLMFYALIGIFSEPVLVTDLSTQVNGEASLPGPTEAQETIIIDRQ